MAFTEALHKRGTGAQGGQFVSKNAAGQTTTSRTIGYSKGSGTGYSSKTGDKNVKALQRELNRLGIFDSKGNQLDVDGKFGPKTQSAVKRLQSRLGLKPDGKITPELLARLRKMTPSRHDRHMMHARHASTRAGKKEEKAKNTAKKAAVSAAKAARPKKTVNPARKG